MANLSQVKTDSNWGDEAPRINENFNAVNAELAQLKSNTSVNIPLFASVSDAQKVITNPYVGKLIFVGSTLPAPVYKWNGTAWENTGLTGGDASAPLENYYTKTEIDSQNDSIESKFTEQNTKFENIDTRTTELNISVLYPTNGLDGTNKYTLQTAIAQVESKYRKAGLKVTFVNESNDTETWEYLGSSWVVANFSKVGAQRFAEQDTKFSELERRIGIISSCKAFAKQQGNQIFYEPNDLTNVNGDVYMEINAKTLTADMISVGYKENNDSSVVYKTYSTFNVGDIIKIVTEGQILDRIVLVNVSTAGDLCLSLRYGLQNIEKNIHELEDRNNTKFTELENHITTKTTSSKLYTSNTTQTNKLYLSSFIIDINIRRKDGLEKDIFIEYILKNVNISDVVYNSINLATYEGDIKFGGIYKSKTEGKGIELIDINDNYLVGTVLVNWDFLPDGQISLGNSTVLTDLGKNDHPGLIDLYNKKNEDYSNIDSLYILNGKLVCNNNYRQESGTVAKYAKVDMGDVVKKVMCRFTIRGGSLALVTTKNNTKNNVTDITSGSVHLVFTNGGVTYGIYKGSWQSKLIEYSTPLTTDDKEEYEVGMEFIGGNVLRIYMPDQTTQDVEIEGLEEYNGNYVIYEEYTYNDTTSFITNEFERVSITGVYCKANSGLPLQDNFNRSNGTINVSQSGHIYRLFRNYIDSDTRYDMSNGIV